MKRMILMCVVLVVTASPLWAGEGEHSNAEMHAAMMAAGTPGEHHKHLARLAGDYTYTAKAWMEPGAEAQEWTGNRSGRMILGGRYLQEEADGSFMGMPFKGMGLWAYDNLAEQYVSLWIDNMGTMMTQATGSCSADGWVMNGSHMVPGMPGENAFKNVVRVVDDNTYVFEWHEAVPGSDEMHKMMEITYTRK